MFGVELGGGLISGSMALLADCMDFLADSATYTISLIVIGMPITTRAKASMFKGLSLLVIAIWIFYSTFMAMINGGVPEPYTMGTIGFIAFLANLVSALLLLRYKEGDANVRSVWLCSRNDAIGNIVVMIAASGILVSNAAWPDLTVAFIMVSLFSHSAFLIIRQSWKELKLGN